jgi:gliding motility-associated-like protein
MNRFQKSLLTIFLFFIGIIAKGQTSVSSISPLSGAPGSTVTITGTNFNATEANNIVFFGATRATVTAASGTSLTVTVPTGASHGPVSVLNKDNGLSAYSRQYFVPTFTPARNSLLNARDFTLDGHIPTGTMSNILPITSGDLDGDGKPDIIMASNAPGNNKLYIRKNTSTDNVVSFAPIIENTITGTNNIGEHIVVGDIDGDGKLDVILPSSNSNNFAVMRNTGSLNAFSSTTFTTGNAPYGLTVFDFDGDGKLDVAVSNGGDGTISIFRNNGTGPGSISFEAAFTTPASGSTSQLVVADFNGDGKPDILSSRSTFNQIRILENTSIGGTLSFSISDFIVMMNPGPISVGDLDKDGKLDAIVTTNNGSNTKFGILRNTSTANIAFAYQEVEVGYAQPYSALSDLNGDGKLDLVLTLRNGDVTVYYIAVLTNQSTIGNIVFSPQANLTTQRFPTRVEALDFTGDGKPDLVSSNSNTGTLSLYRNTLQSPPKITALSANKGAPSTSLTLTGSGFHTTLTNNVVYFGPVKAVVTAASETSLTVTIPFGATHALISVLNTSNSMTGYSLKKFLPIFTPNKATLRASDIGARAQITTVANPYDIISADFDGDGKPDLLTDNASNTLNIHQNTSSSGVISFGARMILTSNSGTRYMAVGDVDGDGKLDIAVPNLTSNNVSIFRNNGIGSIGFDPKVDFTTGLGPACATFADLDADGRLELIVGNYNEDKISIFRNTTVGTTISFDPKVDITVGTSPISISATDIDGDGKLDLVISASDAATGNKISILRNIGSGTISFESAFVLSTGAGSIPWISTTGDIDGDGKPDIVVANNGTNNVSVFRNNSSSGTILFDSRLDFATGSGPRSVALGDLNGDGLPDMVVGNESANNVSIFANTSSSGTVSFAPRLTIAAGSLSPRAIAFTDLDGDGKPDITGINGDAMNVFIYRNQLITTPVTQASAVAFAKQTTTSSQLSWTNGSGQKRAVFVKASETTGTASPVDDIDYTADAVFGNGSQIGSSSWYCVYSGSGSSVTVTGLDPLTPYRAMVVEFSDNSLPNVAMYQTAAVTGNPLNFIPASTITSITKAATNPTDAATVSYDVVLEAPITGLTAANFNLATTGITGASITNVTGSEKNYTVEINTGTGDGTIILRLTGETGLDHSFTNTLPFIGETYTIDKTSPTFSTSALPANATYHTGDPLDLTVTFSEPLTVNTTGGIPSLELTLATGGVVKAEYVSGSGSATLTFRYVVVAGNEDTDGIALATALELNGGTIKDGLGHNANLTVSFPSATAVLIDGIAPSAIAVNRNTPVLATTNATAVIFRVTFSESVSGIDVTDFTLDRTGTVNATVASVTASSGSTINVTVNGITGDGNLGLNLNSTVTGITDVAGNPINGGFTGQVYTIDQTIPTLSAVTITSNNLAIGRVKVGEVVTLSFTASEVVNAPLVTIATHTVTATNTTGNNWTAAYTLTNSDVEGIVPFNISFADLSGNSGTTVTATTNSSSVVFDRSVPTLSTVAIASNNAQTGKAKTGDIITLNFTSNETIGTPTITIATHAVTATNSTGNNWTATYTLTNGDTEGIVPFTIAFIDLTGNNGTTVTATTNSSSVLFDRSVPTLSTVAIASNNAQSGKAKTGDVISLSFTSNETIGTPTITIATHAVTATNTSGSNWTTTYTLTNSDVEGVVPFTIAFIDLTGNTGTIVTTTTNSSSVLFDRSLPTLSTIAIASNNAQTGKAKTGDIITLNFTSNETIGTPTITIASHAVTATNTSGNNWTAAYTLTNSDVEGIVPFSISFADLSGNSGTTVTTTTNSSSVVFDRSVPTLSTVAIASNNAQTGKAKTGDVITLNFTSNETIGTPTITIATHAVTATNTSGNNWTATYTLTNSDVEGIVPFTIAFIDLTGNTGTNVTTTTNSSSVLFDRSVPTLSTVAIASNNAQTGKAKTGDIITLNFTSNETIGTPTITIATHAVTTTNTSGNNWTATYTLTNSDVEGVVPFTIAFIDLTGNTGTNVTTTTNSSSVLFDRSLPTLSTVAIASNNAQTGRSKTGDVVTLNFTSNETIGTPTITIATHAVTATNTSGNNWTATYTLTNSDAEGIVPFTIAFIDLTGNNGTTVTATTNSSSVLFDRSLPTLSTVAIASNNTQTGKAKTGDVITLNFTSNETIGTPTITIATLAVTAINTTGNNWTTTYTLTNSDTEGIVPFNISFVDLSGNNGVTVATTTNGSSVTFDKSAPTFSAITIASSNSNATKARTNDLITISFTTNEPIASPNATILGKSVTATNVGGNNWKIAYTVVNTDAVGIATYAIQATDLAGNPATLATSTTNGSSVTIERPSAINTLASISLSNGTLSPSFNATTANYNVTVAYAVSSITLTPQATDPEAAITVNGSTVLSGNPSQSMTLNPGLNTVTITVVAPDLSASRNYQLTIQREGDAATDISLMATPLYENRPIATLVGTLSSTSAYAGNLFTYTLVTGTGDTDNALFAINGDKVVTTGLLDYENKAVYRIRVRSTNQFGLALEKQVVINLQDVNETPTLAAIANQSSCFTSSAQVLALTGISPGPETGQATTFTVTSSDNNFFTNLAATIGNNGNGTLNYTLKNGVSGTVTVTITLKDNGGTANGGIDQVSRSFTITVTPLPVPVISSDLGTSISLGLTAHLTASGGTNYQWTNAAGIIGGQNTAVLNVRPTINTTYTVTITNANGCSSSQSITINVNKDFESLKASNVLTPNNDGKNDKFIIQNIDLYPNNFLKIFDRNGKILYAKQGYANEWDGNYQGNPLAEGTYYYILNFGDGLGQYSGYISIVRRIN